MYTYMMVKIAYLCGRNYENSAYVLFIVEQSMLI